jgi:PAS domain S-box-containing protein
LKQSLLNDISHFTLLDYHPDPTIYYLPVFDPVQKNIIVDFEVAYGNAAAAQGIGVDVTELSGQKVLSVSWANEETSKALFATLLKVYQSGENSETIYHNPVLDRHFKTLRRKVDSGVLTIARDVTMEMKERVEKERQLALSNLILNTALNSWFSCECIRDENGTPVDFIITRINPVFSRLTGYKEKDVVGKTYLSVFPASRQNGIFDLNCRVIESGVPARQEIRYKGDGLDAWYDVVVTLLGENGLLITFADITVPKNLALAAQRSAAALQTIFDAAQTGMFTFAPEYNQHGNIIDFRFVMVNAAISAFAGKSPELLVGERGTAWFPGYLTNGEFDLYKRCFETGQPQQKEICYPTDAGEVYLYLQSVKIGEQLLVTLTDYSLLRNSQRELEKTVQALKQSNQKLEEFAHAASHDLKEPIRKIAVFAERLENNLDGRLKESEQDMFVRMRRATDRMALLIDDLLTYSHMSLTVMEKETVDLNEKMQSILSDLEVTAEEKKAVVTVGQLPTVKGYRRQLQQLFQNLISNAMKYSRPGVAPVVSIQASVVSVDEAGADLPPDADGVLYHLIEVEDNGIGFEPEYAERIFQMFTRLHGNKEYSGTGIGLSIARKVVENHNGYIRATGSPGKGAKFSVLLPVST